VAASHPRSSALSTPIAASTVTLRPNLLNRL
jgi:hypothetical protein